MRGTVAARTLNSLRFLAGFQLFVLLVDGVGVCRQAWPPTVRRMTPAASVTLPSDAQAMN